MAATSSVGCRDVSSPGNKPPIKLVAEDIEEALQLARASADPRAYRSAVRTIFAGAEAVLWYTKSIALAAAKQDASCSPFELAALADETYTVAANGEVKVRPNFIPMTTSLKLVSRMLSRGQVSNADLSLPKDIVASFEEATKLRHRITHPKSESDLQVTQHDLGSAMSAWATILTLGLNVVIEVDKRLGWGIVPFRPASE